MSIENQFNNPIPPHKETPQISLPEKLADLPSGYAFNNGLEDNLIAELIKYSTSDPLISKNTSDAKRFENRESYLQWRKKNRTIYSLTNEDHSKLLGIVWFGKEAIPLSRFELDEEINPTDYEITIAKRLYDKARGREIAKVMMKIAFSQYLQHQVQNQRAGFWSETSSDNEINVKVNQSLGFRIVSKPNKSNKILMVARFEDLLAALR